ncbi:homoserine kinase [Actinomadura rubteroloni]|uniref:Homoserine kinase n=1 Tax=Actinomadura rubteroloni TaxID=1926885 RepID=A0A2P4UJW6_9ACTN|nr:aminoglycoside phosphotransferase family protein [Actinomadura rubteroloni]POM25331.1 homoserine kinase [Actinomadura rubteroloni]
MDLVTDSDPSRRPPGRRTLRWIEECCGLGSTVRAIRPLPGCGHVNHAVVVETGAGSVRTLVLRRWPRPADENACAIAAEFSPEREIAALTLLAGNGVAAPPLVAADPSGAYTDAPALLLERLPGHPPRPTPNDLPVVLIQTAAALLPIHAVRGASSMPHYVPRIAAEDAAPPPRATRPDVWERAAEIAAGRAPDAPARFIHCDYQPDNTLWAFGALSGVVDWSEVSCGPAAVDVAVMRLHLGLRYGLPVADSFVEIFDQVSGGYAHDPYWDVRVALDALPGGVGVLDEAHVLLHEAFLGAALARLGAAATG